MLEARLRPLAMPIPSLRNRPRHCIVLASRAGAYPKPSLLWAAELARVSGEPLHILRVLPARQAMFQRLVGSRPSQRGTGAERALVDERATRAWLRENLAEEEVEQVVVLEGNFDEQAAAYARGVGARWIVVAPCPGTMGKNVTSLARTCQVPVLVARDRGRPESIVAATDLRSPGYPVLTAAAELGGCLEARVVAVHNVHPLALLVGTGGAWPPIALLPADPSRASRSARLARAAERLAVEACAVVRDEPSVADAVLDEARRQDADLVVVGTRPRGWLQQLLAESVARQIVDRSTRSVLVAPIADPAYDVG
jgi:nucleotide-binding universal stress UspA family protein